MSTVTMLTGTKTKEVSVVDRAANKRVFAITKSEEKRMDILDAVIGTEAEGEVKAIETLKSSGLSDKGADAAVGLYRLMSAFRDELKAEEVNAIAKAAGFEVEEKVEEPEEEETIVKAEELPAELQQVFKAQQEAIQKAEQRNVELAKALTVERDARLSKEYTEKAETEYGHLGAAQEVGEVLKDLHGADAKLAERVESVFKAAQERVEKGDLLKEVGTEASSGVAGDSWGQIQKMAQDFVAKSEGKISEAEAINSVLDTDAGRELYLEYQSEKGA